MNKKDLLLAASFAAALDGCGCFIGAESLNSLESANACVDRNSPDHNLVRGEATLSNTPSNTHLLFWTDDADGKSVRVLMDVANVKEAITFQLELTVSKAAALERVQFEIAREKDCTLYIDTATFSTSSSPDASGDLDNPKPLRDCEE